MCNDIHISFLGSLGPLLQESEFDRVCNISWSQKMKHCITLSHDWLIDTNILKILVANDHWNVMDVKAQIFLLPSWSMSWCSIPTTNGVVLFLCTFLKLHRAPSSSLPASFDDDCITKMDYWIKNRQSSASQSVTRHRSQVHLLQGYTARFILQWSGAFGSTIDTDTVASHISLREPHKFCIADCIFV